MSVQAIVILLGFILGLLMATTTLAMPIVVRGQVEGPGTCLIVNCSRPTLSCVLNIQCLKAVTCNAGCPEKKEVDACYLLCELTYGYNSTEYRRLLQCMSDHGCLPVSPANGVCLADDSDTIKNLTNMAQVKGKWWIVRGLNCGQKGWSDAFDYFPCQRNEFVSLNDSNWVDHIAYCGGNNNTCQTPMCFTKANVSITSPGVMTHWYTDPPLTPQIEEWRVLSSPHPDWMLYIYCGSTPTGKYAGGAVVTRSARTADAIPAYVETLFRATAVQFGFDYDKMCISNTTMCSD